MGIRVENDARQRDWYGHGGLVERPDEKAAKAGEVLVPLDRLAVLLLVAMWSHETREAVR